MSEEQPITETKQKRAWQPKAWKPGESGNPKGRPRKGSDLAGIMRDYLDGTLDTEGGTITRGEAIIKAIYSRAMKGGDGAQTKILAYMVGLPVRDIIHHIDDTEDARYAMLYRLSRTMFALQRDVVESPKRRILLKGGRRCGKTETIARRIVRAMIESPDADVLYIHLTAKNAWAQMGVLTMGVCDSIGLEYRQNATLNELHFGSGGVVRFVGNDSKTEREKMRGYGKNRELVIIDEAQSQAELKYLIVEIIEPTLFDRNGTLVLAGTQPRIPNTFFNDEWERETLDALKSSWNMLQNPYIPNPMEQLETICRERGYSMTDTFIRREYLCEPVFDTEALVLNITEQNMFDMSDFDAWRSGSDTGNLRAVVGVDTGFRDADAVCTLVYDYTRPEIWCTHESVIRRNGVEELKQMILLAISEGQKYTMATVYAIYDYAAGGAKIAADFARFDGIAMAQAEKHNREAGVELLQDDVRRGQLRLLRGASQLVEDAKRIVYKRDEIDRVTRIVDDDTFHSDIFDAMLYAVRAVHNTQRMI